MIGSKGGIKKPSLQISFVMHYELLPNRGIQDLHTVKVEPDSILSTIDHERLSRLSWVPHGS